MRAHVLDSQEQQPEVPLNRRERRAAARGGTVRTGRMPVKAGQKPPPPPARHRDYATRKRG
jgi:hypothetical protein